MTTDELARKRSRGLSVLIVDDHDIVRRGVKQVISETFPDTVFGEARNAAEAAVELHKPGWSIVIMDISLPDGNGLDVLTAARASHFKTPILMLSMFPERQYALSALRAGAAGYLTKDCALAELGPAIEMILGGGKYVSSALSEQLSNASLHSSNRRPHELLSPREYTTICAVVSGKKLKQIGEQLGLNPKTIYTYKRRAMTKMQLTTDADLYRYAQDNHLV